MSVYSETARNPDSSFKSSMYSDELNRSLRSGVGVSGIFVPEVDPAAVAKQDYDAQSEINKDKMIKVFGSIHKAIPDLYLHRDISGLGRGVEEMKSVNTDLDNGFLLGLNRKGTVQVEGYYGAYGEMIVKAATPEEFGKIADVLGENGYKPYVKPASVAESKPAPAPKP